MHAIATNKTKWNLKDGALALVFVSALILIFNVILGFFIKENTDFGKYKSLINMGLFLAQEAIFLIPLYIFIFKKYKLALTDFGFKNIGIKQTAIWVLKGFGLVFLINIIFIEISIIIGREIPGFGPQESHITLFGESFFDIAIAIFVLAIIAPIVEEIFFRGFILQTLSAKLTQNAASITAAAIFALIHFEFQSAGIMFVLALILNWLFLRSKSIVPGIAFHMINNLLAFGLEWIVK